MLQLAPFITALALMMLATYGANRAWQWLSTTRRGGSIAALALTALTAGVMAQPASAQSQTIDFDIQPFFDSLNSWLPTMIQIFAIVGGIIGAMALARYIISTIVKAFQGGQL